MKKKQQLFDEYKKNVKKNILDKKTRITNDQLIYFANVTNIQLYRIKNWETFRVIVAQGIEKSKSYTEFEQYIKTKV